LKNRAFLLLQLEVCEEAVASVLKHARANHIKTILDPAPARLLPKWLLATHLTALWRSRSAKEEFTGRGDLRKRVSCLIRYSAWRPGFVAIALRRGRIHSRAPQNSQRQGRRFRRSQGFAPIDGSRTPLRYFPCNVRKSRQLRS
jgi:hypothetical protein